MMSMTQIYIDEFKSTGGGSTCKECNAPAEKSLCRAHLRLAAERFMSWVGQRRRQGLCILCQRRGQKLIGRDTHRERRGVRCAFHRGINVERCRAWSATNGPRVYQERVQSGVCAGTARH